MNKARLLRRLLAGIALAASISASAGVYDDILIAAQNGDNPKVIELLRRGMDVNTSDRNGDTLVMIAARSGNGELLDFLLRSRANAVKRNKYGDSPIMAAAMQGHVDAVKRLLEAGADIHQPGWTALHYAAYAGHPKVVGLLIDRKADLDARAPNGQTALMLAAAAGHLEAVKLLIDADADMDLEDPDGHTALDLAEKNGQTDVAAYLRTEGALE